MYVMEDIGVESVVCRSTFIDWIKEPFPGHKKVLFRKVSWLPRNFLTSAKKGNKTCLPWDIYFLLCHIFSLCHVKGSCIYYIYIA